MLIADEDNNRLIVVSPAGKIVWQFPQPGDLAQGQTFKLPDDAFFSPDGKQIGATQEENSAISVIDVVSTSPVAVLSFATGSLARLAPGPTN